MDDYLIEIADEVQRWSNRVGDSLDSPSRAQIAMHLMAGMLAAPESVGVWDVERMARLSVIGADALLAALKEGES